MQLRKLAAAMLVMGLTAGAAQAEDAAATTGQSTLDKIAKNGVIVVGHRESSVPFSYYDNKQQVVGYSQTTQMRSLMPSRKAKQTGSAGEADPGYVSKPYPAAAKRYL